MSIVDALLIVKQLLWGVITHHHGARITWNQVEIVPAPPRTFQTDQHKRQEHQLFRDQNI